MQNQSVFKRLLALITNAAQLIAENGAIKKQAESASKMASSLLETSSAKDSKKSDEKPTEDSSKLLKQREEEIEQLNKSLKLALLDMETMRKQSENVAKEYDNLLKEHARLQAKLESGSGDDGKKKN